MDKPLKTTLPNGLRIILLESHAAPVVSFHLWANVGSVNESDAEAGICHLIEHMLFKGTGRRPVGQIAREIEAAGGDINAYTSLDETVFYVNMSSKRWEVGVDVLADAASDPTFDEGELQKEKEVIVEEISRSEDNPSHMASQDLFAKAYQLHPYRRPIAGSRETVHGISRPHLLDFYKKWYVAEKLILIGVGDFQKEKILPKIELLFSKIPGGTPSSQEIPEEPTPTTPRFVTRGMTVEGRYLDLAFPIPNLTHSDIPAIDILSHILGGGASSRLEQVVKEKKRLVASIGAYPYSPRYPGLLIIGAVLKDRALRETLKAIFQEVERLQAAPPPTVEFARAREAIRSLRIYERQTVDAMARKMACFEGLAGDLGFEEEYYRRLGDVTPEEVRGVAQTYLKPERLTLAFCHPREEAWPLEKIREGLPPSSPKQIPRLRPPREIAFFRLPSGLRLLVRENHTLPLISLRSASFGGTRLESRKINGSHHLIALLLTKGTSHRTAREIAEVTDNLSGHMDGYSGQNLLGLHGTFLSEKLTEGIELFSDLLLHPEFPEEEVRKEKGHTATAIRNEEDSLPKVAMRRFLSALYPHHPYGLPLLGTVPSVRSLLRKTLLHLYQKALSPASLVLSVVGDVNTQEIRERFEEKLALKKTAQRVTAVPLPRPPPRPISVWTRKKKLQAHIVYGFLGTTIQSPDRYALEVLNYVLAGQGGRLFLELRDRQGLAYAVSSSSQEGIEPGWFAVYMGTDPKNVDRALTGIRQELQRVPETPVTKEELERAKRFIIGNYELDLQRNESVAALLAFNEIYGLPQDEIFRYPERIERVTHQDILRVARKYLRPEASVLSVIKP